MPERYVTPVTRRCSDRCEGCGRFVGHYPAGFYCDTHCSRCVCQHCPATRKEHSDMPSYRHHSSDREPHAS